jgi:tight adherence protein B
MNIALPIVVVLGVGGAVAIAFFAFWERIVRIIAELMEPYRVGLERAAIPMRSEELAFTVLALGTVPWGVVTVWWRPMPVLGAALLVITLCFSFFLVRAWINARVYKRAAQFNNQLEMVLRLIAGAMRVGLGLRQAIVNVVADMPDPARVEFSRVLSQTQIGVSIFDALDQLTQRMPSAEMSMMANAVRLQSQTGGNLSRVLENLAGTIKDRRRLERKIRTLTAEARATKYIISALPIFVGLFVMAAEPEMRQGLLGTVVGRVCMLIVCGLLALGWYLFNLISRIDI